MAGFGIAMPVSQALLFFNGYRVGLGYAFLSRFDVMATLSGGGCVDLVDGDGTDGFTAHQYCNVRTMELGGEVRARLVAGLYVSGGAGRASVTAADSVIDREFRAVAPGFTRHTPYVSAGLGYRGSFFSLEVRHLSGLERIPIAGDVTARLETTSVLVGFDLGF